APMICWRRPWLRWAGQLVLLVPVSVLGLQVAEKIFDLVFALHRGEALLELSFAEVRARLGDEKRLLSAALGSGLIDTAPYTRHGGRCAGAAGDLLTGAGTTMFDSQQLAAGLRLLEALLQ